MPHPLTKSLVATIASLKERGDVAELRRVLDGLNEGLGVPAESYSHLLEDAEANRQKVSVRLPKEIRDAAANASFEFKASPPFYRVGCFTLKQKEKRPDTWDLSALDNVVLTTVQATTGRELVEVVAAQVSAIEGTLKQLGAFAKDLTATYALVNELLPGTERFAPNLLLLLLNTKNPRRLLTTGELEVNRPLSRTAFGFALAALQKDPSVGDSLELKPATQLETSKGFTYVSVPVGTTDPRTICDSRPIAALRFGQ